MIERSIASSFNAIGLVMACLICVTASTSACLEWRSSSWLLSLCANVRSETADIAGKRGEDGLALV